jgi:hypothetical protein
MIFSRRVHRWQPAWLAALAVAGGIAAVTGLRDTLGQSSGALLIAAALASVLLRRLDRRAQMAALFEQHSSFVAPPSRLAITTDFVRAIMPPTLGHLDLDRQHRSLAARAGTLHVAFFHGDDPADLEVLVHELIDKLAHHVQFEIEAMARLGVVRKDEDVDADRLQVANAEYDFHLYCSGLMSLEELINRVAGPLVAGHLARRHPTLPSLESALQRLRGIAAPH